MFVGACGAPFTGGVCPRVFQRCMGVQLFALFVERGDGKIFRMLTKDVEVKSWKCALGGATGS